VIFDGKVKLSDGGPPPKGYLHDFDHSVYIRESSTNSREVIAKALNEITVRISVLLVFYSCNSYIPGHTRFHGN
jgi:hypothetical protein